MKHLLLAALASILLAGQAFATVVKVEDAGINDGVDIEVGNPGFGSSGPVTLDWDPFNDVDSSLRRFDSSSLSNLPFSYSGRDAAWCGEVVSSCALDITVDSGFSVTLTSFFLGAFDGDRDFDFTVVDLGNILPDITGSGVLDGVAGLLVSGSWSSTVGFRIIFGSDWNVGINDITYESASVSSVPLPVALPLLGAGLGALGFMGWRRKRPAGASRSQ